jgi:FSR family fosmidomycin resistance protein-like MFS transporter
MQPRRATSPGIFVGPGALGLAVGIWAGKGGFVVAWPFLIALSLAFVVTLFLPDPPHPYALGREPSAERGTSGILLSTGRLIVALLLISIVVRSLVGMAGSYRCPKEIYVMFGLATAAMAGKILGGIVSDRLGWLETSVVALLMSAPLIVFGGETWWVLVAGMFLFQMTMPVTLTAIALIYPNRPGFAFGLTCLALVGGAVLTFSSTVRAYYHPYAFLAMIIISTIAVYFGLRLLGDDNPVKGVLTRSHSKQVSSASV